MTKRIFRSILGVSLIVLAASLVLVTGVLYGYFQDRMEQELRSRTTYIAHGVEQTGTSYLKDGLPEDSRITWIASDGTVLWDSWEDAAAMENHAGRQEVRQALLGGSGSAVRYSDTLAQKTIYYALRLDDGSVLRVSDTQYTVWVLVLQALQPVALMMLLAAALAAILASRVARDLVAPINALDLDAPADAVCYEELSPLLSKIRSQQRQIHRQMEDLRRRQEEFSALTENMSEGFVAVDQQTRVLSCNPAAARLLGAQGAPEGESIYALNREAPFRRCVEEALAGRRCEVLLEGRDTCRQVIASPAEEGQTTGAVLMILDVTEKERREALRREFTANVSHELKTPLTSILGTAEILKGGLVAPADVEHFAGNIYRQTQRLISLVNDIIRLSRLDEGGDIGPWETVELQAVARRVLDRLAEAAEQKQVTLSLEGGEATVRGVSRIVEEILYNLCDNAVVYNRPGGSVTVTVEDLPGGARVSVADTGVGIPREAQGRVFERFYRVDKSHSGGGTGLGLSIVKHGAAYLGAQVSLESQEGKGSTFTVTFPPAEEKH